MTRLATSSYRQFRLSMGLPVAISLTTPKWMPDAADWPVCRYLQPRWSYFRAEAAEFGAAYLGQLERFGVSRIARDLHQIARQNGDPERLVLVCHESKMPVTAETCHRRLWADWWLATGEEVEELG